MPETRRPFLPVEEEAQAPTPRLDEDDPFSSMMKQFDEAAALIGLAPDVYRVLRAPDLEFRFALPVAGDDGSIQVFDGYRIQHNISLGPCLGGFRLDAHLTREELRALAAWTTWKCAALNVPFGGSMGGVNFNPRRHKPETTERVVRRYTSGVLDLIGPQRDILFPDLHCDQQVMAWVLDTWSMHARHTENAVVVGKPLGLGGTLGRESAIGRGVAAVTEARLGDLGREGPARVVIQGAGEVGAQVAREMVRRGHSVVGIGDLHGALYREDGLDLEAALAYRNDPRHRTVAGFREAENLTPAELLALECDVLIPAATANQITRHNAAGIRARLLVEAANGPTTAAGERVLLEKGIPIVPDILGNAGAVLIAYFEWVQNRGGFQWPESLVHKRLDRMVLDAYRRARKVAEERRVGLRLAACVLGVERVARFDELRGIYP